MTKAVGRCLVAAAVVAGSVLTFTPQAHAAPVEIVVTTVALEGPGSLREALETANSSSNADGVRIVFADGLAGGIEFTSGSADDSMYTEHVGNTSGNVSGSIGQNGARYFINADVPVEIDFANLPDGIVDVDGSHAAGIFIASNDVTLSNLSNLRAAEAAFAISGDRVTLNNVAAVDDDEIVLEAGVALLDGADATTISDSTFSSAYWANIIVDTGATVSNTTINGSSSHLPEGFSHIIFEDDAVVNNFTLNGSTIGGADENRTEPGFYLNPGNMITGLTITDTQFLTPGQDGFTFVGAQTINGATITGNTFAGTEDRNYGRPFGASNPAEWNNLVFSDNTIENAGGTVFGGSVTDAQFTNNIFTTIDDGARAALQLGGTLSNVAVSGNTFNELWTLDTIRVEGDADGVVIENNTLNNLNASVSRAGVGIYAGGSDNVVRNNVLFQDLADESLRPDNDNHWAVFIAPSARAADVDSVIGWEITGNSIDGFGGRDRSQAPIVVDAIGKALVTGNTFGPNRDPLEPAPLSGIVGTRPHCRKAT